MQSSIPENRPLSLEEQNLLRWLLENGGPAARQHLPEIDGLRVVSRCGCGCASIDFFTDTDAGLVPLSDHQWNDEAGHLFGVFAFSKRGVLAGLEVWSIDGAATPATLPAPSALSPIEFNSGSDRGHSGS